MHIFFFFLQLRWTEERVDFVSPLACNRKENPELKQSLHHSKNSTKIWKWSINLQDK